MGRHPKPFTIAGLTSPEMSSSDLSYGSGSSSTPDELALHEETRWG